MTFIIGLFVNEVTLMHSVKRTFEKCLASQIPVTRGTDLDPDLMMRAASELSVSDCFSLARAFSLPQNPTSNKRSTVKKKLLSLKTEKHTKLYIHLS